MFEMMRFAVEIGVIGGERSNRTGALVGIAVDQVEIVRKRLHSPPPHQWGKARIGEHPPLVVEHDPGLAVDQPGDAVEIPFVIDLRADAGDKRGFGSGMHGARRPVQAATGSEGGAITACTR